MWQNGECLLPNERYIKYLSIFNNKCKHSMSLNRANHIYLNSKFNLIAFASIFVLNCWYLIIYTLRSAPLFLLKIKNFNKFYHFSIYNPKTNNHQPSKRNETNGIEIQLLICELKHFSLSSICIKECCTNKKYPVRTSQYK